MTTYRVGSHHGVTVIAEGDGARCGRPGHDCARGHLIGVMLTADDATLVVEALNGRAPGGRRSRLGDLIVMHGPYEPFALIPNPVTRYLESDELNALRDELIELREIQTGRAAQVLDESDVDLDISLPPLTRPARKVRVTPKRPPDTGPHNSSGPAVQALDESDGHCDGTCTGHGGPRADYADWWQEHTDDDGELLAWLRAQLDEDERAVQRLPDGYRLYACDDGCLEQPSEKWADGTDRLPNHHNTWLRVYDKAERLAELDAKRRILDRYADAHWHAPAIPGATSPILRAEETGACRTCVTMRLLALPYADRPGYQESWRSE